MKYKYMVELESNNQFTIQEICSVIDEGMEEYSGAKYRIISVTDETPEKDREEQ